MDQGGSWPSGIDHTYRLLLASFVIRRMRISRWLKRWKARRHDSRISRLHERKRQTPLSASRVFVFSSILLALACAALAGHWLGFREKQSAVAAANSASPVIDEPSLLVNQNSPEIQKPDARADWSRQLALAISAVEKQGLERQIQLQSELITALQGELAARSQVDALSRTLDSLRARIATLEGETIALEAELLNRDRALAEAASQLDDKNTERRTIYNITNIPIGSAVSDSTVRSLENASSRFEGSSDSERPDMQAPGQSDQVTGDGIAHEQHWQGVEGGDRLQGEQHLNEFMDSIVADELQSDTDVFRDTEVETADESEYDADRYGAQEQEVTVFGPAPDRIENP